MALQWRTSARRENCTANERGFVFCRTLFVCLNAFAGVALSAVAQNTAPNEWTWIGGTYNVTSPNGPTGVYGKPGTPAAGNIPGGRDSAATWTDSNGNFWLFGGEGADALGNFGQLNDLWEFNPSTQQWTWMGGSPTLPASCAGSTTAPCGQPGVYGTLGSAAAANIPGGRSYASYWTDSSGNFWLFGGYGFDADQNLGELNDLWEFNPASKEWTWMGGSSKVGSNGGQSGAYGILGSTALSNIPGGRGSATSWTDKSGQFWMYGGEGFDSQGNLGQLNDLWVFDPAAGEWTWMGGSSTLPAACATTAFNGNCGWPAIYGALGAPAPGISPGTRVGAAGWTDSDGNLWLFGGFGSVFWEQRDFSEIDQYDLWKFNPSADQWAWMSGNTTSICGESTSEENWCGQVGIYGTLGTPSISNIPPSRSDATSWIDTDGNLWLFGGAQSATTNIYGPNLCNDVWVFEPAANEWAWMSGAAQFGGYSCLQTLGNYGVLGTPAPTNTPGGRFGAASWTDTHGNFWVFGGDAEVDINDLWVYKPVAPAPEPSFEIIASPNPINIGAVNVVATDTPTITTGTTTVSILAAEGFDYPVTLTATTDTCNGITCITGSFSPATITGAGSTTLTISVYGTVSTDGIPVLVPEARPLTITATGGGFSQSIEVIVDVTEVGETEAPSFSIPTGTYSIPQTVTITDSDLTGYNNAFIYYTTDGTAPTASSAVYVNPITVASTATLKAIAILGDLYQSAVSSATYTIVPPSPNFSISGTAVSVTPGATSGNTSTITLTPSDGFTGMVSLSCAITPTAASDPATCSIPASVTITDSTAQTTTLTVNTTPAASAFSRARMFFQPLVGGAALACILLFSISARRKGWTILGLLVLIFSVAGSALGCGGSRSGGGSGAGESFGTTPDTYVITVTGTSGTITETGMASLTVQ
jgi:N-acetylneuraminic acid mutarotase